MPSIANGELKKINECISKVTRGNNIAGVCLYGSRAAGYARSESDYDILVILENYSHIVKYLYKKIQGLRISLLIVDLLSVEKDAKYSFLGEFVIGRLLHVYEPILNPDLFERLERTYKKRVIIEQLGSVAKSLSKFSTEVSFPLEYIMFSKIKNRCSLHPNAVYSFLQTYVGNNAPRNIKIAIKGYQMAFQEIISDNSQLVDVTVNGNMLRLVNSQLRTSTTNRGVNLRLGRKFHELSSYAIHAYAGRKILHYMMRETQSKINRQRQLPLKLPRFIKSPEDFYWNIPEGKLIFNGTNWLQEYAKYKGFQKYGVAVKKRLGKAHNEILKYTISDADTKYQKSIIVKNFARSNMGRSPILVSWLTSQKIPRSHPLFLLGTEYKALRYLRSIGIRTPLIESVVIEHRLLVTEHIEGMTLEALTNNLLAGRNLNSLYWLGIAGEDIATIHLNHSALGSVRPADLIISDKSIFFTGLDHLEFRSGDLNWDAIRLIACALGKTSNIDMAKEIARTYFNGYKRKIDSAGRLALANSNPYIESLDSIISRPVGKIIANELDN